MVSDTKVNQGTLPLSAALCVGHDAFNRFGRVLRHLAVGLVDQAVHLRLLSSDPRVESLTLGPIQTLMHGSVGWPVARRRIHQLVEELAPQPPTTVHALSTESYRVARAIADAFDADLVLQVTALSDCEGVAESSAERVGRFLVFSEPLVTVLTGQLHVPPEHIVLIRPGIRASETNACFAEANRAATVLCTSPFERGSGVDRLLDASQTLRAKGHEFFVFLLGQGRQEAALRRTVHERKLSSCVTFAHPLGDLTQAMQSADIFVRPSADKAFSVDALLAMGAGMIVVTFPNSVCDHVRGGETAVVCNEPTADALAGALEQVLTDRDTARRIADTGRRRIVQEHTISEMARRTAGAYRELAIHRATFRIKE